MGHRESDRHSPLFSYLDSMSKCPSWKRDKAIVCYHRPANDTVNTCSNVAENQEIQDYGSQ